MEDSAETIISSSQQQRLSELSFLSFFLSFIFTLEVSIKHIAYLMVRYSCEQGRHSLISQRTYILGWTVNKDSSVSETGKL